MSRALSCGLPPIPWAREGPHLSGRKDWTQARKRSGDTDAERRYEKEDVWAVYDMFRSMDKKNQKHITRNDFLAALDCELSIGRLRMLHRLKLHDRFSRSAADVTLKEMLLRMWPRAAPEDLRMMDYWVQLREVQCILMDRRFRGDVTDLRRIFKLLDVNCDGIVAKKEIVSAGLFTELEMRYVLDEEHSEGLSFQDLCNAFQSKIKGKFARPEVNRKDEEEERKSMFSPTAKDST
mmetsp:Transcript_21757/g.48479  ORF Transcript_21757/g.48479 Transcript_21757/m.48479 type:complete len:236 (-) Transcript_21757:73-780(-)